MSFNEQGDRTDLGGEWLGSVSDRNDPEGRGRVRVTVPGLFGETGSFWLLPKLPAVGDGVGMWTVPPKGARVVVSLSGGCSTELGWYQPVGWFSAGDPKQLPPVESDGGDPDVVVVATSRYAVVMDPRAAAPYATLTDRVHGDSVRLDGKDLSLTIHATSRLTLSSDGAVEIRAPLVSINDRSVLPSTSEPI